MSFEAIKWAWDQPLHDGGEKLVLLALAQCCNSRHGYRCYPAHKKLADMCNMSVRTVQRKLISLAESGLINWEYRAKVGEGRKSNVYILPVDDKRQDDAGGNGGKRQSDRGYNNGKRQRDAGVKSYPQAKGGNGTVSDNVTDPVSDRMTDTVSDKRAHGNGQQCRAVTDTAMSDRIRKESENNIEQENAPADAGRVGIFSPHEEKDKKSEQPRRAKPPTLNGKPVSVMEYVSTAKIVKAERQEPDTGNGSADSSEPESTPPASKHTASSKKEAFISDPETRQRLAAELAKHGYKVKS